MKIYQIKYYFWNINSMNLRNMRMNKIHFQRNINEPNYSNSKSNESNFMKNEHNEEFNRLNESNGRTNEPNISK